MSDGVIGSLVSGRPIGSYLGKVLPGMQRMGALRTFSAREEEGNEGFVTD